MIEITIERSCPAGCIKGRVPRVEDGKTNLDGAICPICEGRPTLQQIIPCVSVVLIRDLDTGEEIDAEQLTRLMGIASAARSANELRAETTRRRAGA